MRDDFEPDDGDFEEMDIADEVAYADTGRPWGARAIKHPSMRATRKHFAERPLPGQQDRRAS